MIVVSARDQEKKIRALDAGADDYLTKPFGARATRANRVALRYADQKRTADEPVFKVDDLRWICEAPGFRRWPRRSLDTDRVQALDGPSPISKVMTHRLLKEVWGMAFAEHTPYLRVFMAQLRHKLEIDPARPRYLLTEPGVGYRVRVT